MQGSNRSRWFHPIAAGELEAVDAAIRAYGINRFARDMGVYSGSVASWVLRGIPSERVLDAETLLAIPRSKIRPDIYGDLTAPRKKKLLQLRELSRQYALEKREREKKRKA